MIPLVGLALSLLLSVVFKNEVWLSFSCLVLAGAFRVAQQTLRRRTREPKRLIDLDQRTGKIRNISIALRRDGQDNATFLAV